LKIISHFFVDLEGILAGLGETGDDDELEAPKGKQILNKAASGLGKILQNTLPPLVKDIAKVLKPFDEVSDGTYRLKFYV